MKPVDIVVPRSARLTNHLYPSMNPEYLTQDLVTVALPSGFFIDVGWYPEHDPSGEYWVRVFREEWDNQQLPRPIRSRNIREVVDAVNALANRFSNAAFLSVPSTSAKNFKATVAG